MSILEKMKAEMLNLSQKLKLPEVYAGDVEQDLTLIEQFSGYQMLWVLRTCGSALIPLKAGVHPVHVTHWIWGNSGCYQRCKTDPPQRLKIDPGVNLLL
ncbi:TPA: hypothetical protein ACNVXU_004386 [Klebsiella pneumoniae]